MALKQLYLDALGEPRGSARRSAVTGIQAAYTLNQGSPDQEIQVLLLDERCVRCEHALYLWWLFGSIYLAVGSTQRWRRVLGSGARSPHHQQQRAACSSATLVATVPPGRSQPAPAFLPRLQVGPGRAAL